MKTIPIISNCQGHVLTRIMPRYCRGYEFVDFGIHLLGATPDATKINDFIARHAQAQFIFSVPLSDQFGPLASTRIGETFPAAKIITIQSLFFSGFHPDLTYMGGRGERAFGPLGDYHSRIAAAAWLNGLSIDDAVKQYRHETYLAIGFYNEFDTSFAEMRDRAKGLDVNITDKLFSLARQRNLFFSVNHPTSLTFSIKAFEMAKIIDAQGLLERFDQPFPPEMLVNPLAVSNLFPVYPEIAEYHSASISRSYDFVGEGDGKAQRVYGLREFIAGEYACFEKTGAQRVGDTPRVRDIARTIMELA